MGAARPTACLRDPSPCLLESYGRQAEGGFGSQGDRSGRQARSLRAYAYRRASARLPSR
jgi:hypothetical protein